MKINNIEVAGELPFVVNQFSGTLVVLGTGSTLWNDVLWTHQNRKPHWMAINRAILDFPEPLEHGISCHPYEILLFTLFRRTAYPHQQHMISHSCCIYDEASFETHFVPQFCWDFPEYYHGSSALTGVLAGLVMGYDEIILAGVPMDNSGYYYNPWVQYPYKEKFMEDWEKAAKQCFDGKVTSMSGNTRELLGAPNGF